jgi:ferredoxin-NADP reductase
MYMGVTFALMALLGIVAIASVFGSLAYTPLSIVSGAIIFVFVSLLTNHLLGYVFSVKTQFQSAIISGLILSFLFTPPSQASDYIAIIMISVIAMASKYILTWKGRHIFNPAALAAVIISLTGITTASWWVATPVLFIPMILLGTFTLYRTHRLTMGYLYITVAVVVSLLVTSFDSKIYLDTVWLIFTSYPILFLAYFMLSEPLTQAPRNWQRNSIAIGVAFLASIQLFVGNLFISPELALVIGNLAAFMLGQRRAIKLRFVGKTEYGNGQIAYDFLPLASLHFKAGQYIELSLAHKAMDVRGMRRMFSIASAERSKHLRIITRHSDPSSSFKKRLSNLKKDEIVPATGIYGDFVLPCDTRIKIVLLAGGIGVTPFLSHMSSIAKQRDIILLYFIRDENDVVDSGVFDQAKQNGMRIVFIENESIESAFTAYVKDGRERIAYISGSPAFVDSAKASVKHRSRSVVTDYFSGY